MSVNPKSLIAIMAIIVIKIGLVIFKSYVDFSQNIDVFGGIDNSYVSLLSLLLSIILLVYLKIFLNSYLEIRNANWAIYGLIVLAIIEMIFYIPEIGFDYFSNLYLIKSRSTSILSFVFTLGLAINILRIENEQLQNNLKFYGYTLIITSFVWLLFPFITPFFGYLIIFGIMSLIGFLTPIALLLLYNKAFKILNQEEDF